MRIAVVGSGPVGLEVARRLGEDPRHVTTVFETRSRLGGRVEERRVAEPLAHLVRLGVTLRRGAQVERLAVHPTGVLLWIHGRPEAFDVALVTTSPAQRQALFTRSGPVLSRGRVHCAGEAPDAAGALLARLAAAHPEAGPLPALAPDGSPAHERVRHALRSLTRHGRRVRYIDLSGQAWPLDRPAVFLADHRWLLDVTVPAQLLVRSLRVAGSGDARVAVRTLQAGTSLGVVSGDDAASRAAATAALAVNAPIVALATHDNPGLTHPRAAIHVVIGEPFYPQTSCLDELTHDMRVLMRHLARLASDRQGRETPAS
jgi:hypothetical protein